MLSMHFNVSEIERRVDFTKRLRCIAATTGLARSDIGFHKPIASVRRIARHRDFTGKNQTHRQVTMGQEQSPINDGFNVAKG